jgi:hypothetical protein
VGFFSGLVDLFFGKSGSINGDSNDSVSDTEINPASGLPMVGGIGGVDIEGNPYGTDSDDMCSSFDDGLFSSCDDSFSSFDDDSFSSFDDDY